MKHASRGAALVETAIVVGLSLLVIFAAVQYALLGFSQAAADGAAFVAAHSQAVGSTTGTVNGVNVAETPFPLLSLTGNSLTTAAGAGTVTSQSSVTMSGVNLAGGSTQFTMNGGDVETSFSGAGSNTGQFSFSMAGTDLVNINPIAGGCPVANGCSACPSPNGTLTCYPIYLAQRLDTTGNGLNGQWSEWTCHLDGYQAQSFPATSLTAGSKGFMSPTGYTQSNGTAGIAGSAWDPSTPKVKGDNEAQIYASDNGVKTSGINC